MAGLFGIPSPAIFGTPSPDPWSNLRQAQVPGQARAQPQARGLGHLLDPEVALPMAAALMGDRGNMGNFGAAFGAAGPAMGAVKKRNQTYDWLRKNAPDFADLIDGGMEGGEAMKLFAQQRYAKTPKGQGYINAGGGNLFNAETGEWVSAPGGGAEGVAGLVPVWLQDKDGNPVLGQMTKDGKVIRSEIDEGLSPVGPYEKSFETGRGSAEGKTVGEAAGALPGATQLAQNVAQQVEDLKNDPYLPRMLGPIESQLPNITQDAARVQDKINQIKGGAFLNGRQALKGGGAITDFESGKAEAAYARLNQAQSPEDFKQALDEFNYYVQQGLMKLQAQADQSRLGPGRPQGGGSMKDKYGLD